MFIVENSRVSYTLLQIYDQTRTLSILENFFNEDIHMRQENCSQQPTVCLRLYSQCVYMSCVVHRVHNKNILFYAFVQNKGRYMENLKTCTGKNTAGLRTQYIKETLYIVHRQYVFDSPYLCLHMQTINNPYPRPTPVNWYVIYSDDERTMVKELGKMLPYLRQKEVSVYHHLYICKVQRC